VTATRDPVGEATPPPRAPITLELRYRSDVALLVSYATQIVKGELTLNTQVPIRNGTPAELRLSAPASAISLSGVVSGTRADSGGRPQFATMDVKLNPPSEAIGQAVDRLAFEFRGITALVAASQAAPRAHLIRYLRAIINCRFVEIDQKKLSEPGAVCNVDLALVDLDSSGPAGYELFAQLRQHADARTAPVLALAQLERDRARAASLGFDEALSNPPAFAELQAATLRCLAKPSLIVVGP
jgi:CheY-like chemotaxis protein